MKKRELCPLSGVHLTIKPKYCCLVRVFNDKNKAEIQQENFSLIFCRVKLVPDSNNTKLDDAKIS